MLYVKRHFDSPNSLHVGSQVTCDDLHKIIIDLWVPIITVGMCTKMNAIKISNQVRHSFLCGHVRCTFHSTGYMI